MDEYVVEYITIRERVLEKLRDMVDVYLTNIWDPMMKYMIIKEVQLLLNRELKNEYPDFPHKYFPNVKIKIYEEEHEIEIGIQEYLNKDTTLMYLGTTEFDCRLYDLYCRESWDSSVSHIFYARYGHGDTLFDKGSKEPAAQYMMGIITPLSTAYSFAIDEGLIE